MKTTTESAKNRNILLSEIKKLNLYDLLNTYMEAKKGEYLELSEVLTSETMELINELDNELNDLLQ